MDARLFLDRQEQTWIAAHELGHVWKEDTYVKDKLNKYNIDDLVNRFAAELLLPEDIFKKELDEKLKELLKSETTKDLANSINQESWWMEKLRLMIVHRKGCLII